MIDLHCHILPGIDDGSRDDATSLEMARIAAADGIRIVACTPHIYPGLYENDANGIRARVAALQGKLDEAGIALKLTFGADAHLTPELFERIKDGTAPTLHGSRYFCWSLRTTRAAAVRGIGVRLHRLRLRAGNHSSRTPVMDQRPLSGLPIAVQERRVDADHRRQSHRPLRQQCPILGGANVENGIVHLIATDAHGIEHRPPLLAEGMHAAAKWVGPRRRRGWYWIARWRFSKTACRRMWLRFRRATLQGTSRGRRAFGRN